MLGWVALFAWAVRYPRDMPARYQLLALDLDGTLFDPAGGISDANVRAVRAARAAGLVVTICTGRGLVECADALAAIGQVDPVIVAGGAITACPVTRRTQHRFSISHALVRSAVATLLEHEHPALVLKDPLEAGYDYLVVTGERGLPLDPVTEWWFRSMDVKVRRVSSLDEDEHPEHTVRVGACGLSGTMARISKDLHEFAEGRAIVHHFPAVVAPEHASKTADGQTLHVLELFDPRGNKWSALQVLAGKLGVDPSRIAAIGDEINDLTMIEGAGLGVAMGNAVSRVKAAAKRETRSNADDGVAHAIEHILSGAW